MSAVPFATVQPEQKQAICADCLSRMCCYHYRVTITGFDLWRISQTLDIPAAQFVAYAPAGPESDSGFQLVAGGECYELVLSKTADVRRHGGCVFLVKTRSGIHRCGLGELQPDACAIYPAYIQEDGLLRVVNDPDGCWRSWSAHELDPERERRRFENYARHQKEYAEIVSQWNERVAHSQREYGSGDFTGFLENCYTARYGGGQ